VSHYSHLAVEAVGEQKEGTRRECRACGVEVIGLQSEGTLRHHDENIRTIRVDREYLPAVHDATEAIAAALSQVTSRARPEEFARAAAVAVYSAGLLRQRAVKPKVGTKH
jgi:hypothetical protein